MNYVNSFIEDTNLSPYEHSVTRIYKAGVRFLIINQISFMVYVKNCFKNMSNDWDF